MAVTTRTITGTILATGNTPAVGTVRLTQPIALQGPAEDTTIQPGTHASTLDEDGVYTLTVPVNDDPAWSPSGWAYTLEIEVEDWRYRANVGIPSGPTTSLADLTPVTDAAPDDASTYVLKASVGTVTGPAGPLDGDGLIPFDQVPRAYVGASTLAAPLLSASFDDLPATSDANVGEFWYTSGGTARLATWWNEIGRYRAEQQASSLYDHLITLVASNAVASGVLIRFERRDGSNARVTTGGVNQDGRLQTSLYTPVDITSIDPGGTGRYTEGTTLAVRLETDDRVWLRGQVAVSASGTSSGHVVCVVPAGYAPTYSQYLPVPTTGGILVPCEVIASTGEVVARRTQSGAFSLSLDNLSYVR